MRGAEAMKVTANSYVNVFQPIPGNYCKSIGQLLKNLLLNNIKTIIKKVLYLLNISNNINKINWSQSQLLPEPNTRIEDIR
jgi:hypothetical protein